MQVNAFGLTPGSSHAVELAGPNGTVLAQFSPLMANGMGQAQGTLYSTDTTPVPDGSHLVILIDGQGGAIASEPIAQTPAIAADELPAPVGRGRTDRDQLRHPAGLGHRGL